MCADGEGLVTSNDASLSDLTLPLQDGSGMVSAENAQQYMEFLKQNNMISAVHVLPQGLSADGRAWGRTVGPRVGGR